MKHNIYFSTIVIFMALLTSFSSHATATQETGGRVQGSLKEFREKLEGAQTEQILFNESVKALQLNGEMDVISQSVTRYVAGLFNVSTKINAVLNNRDEVLAVLNQTETLLRKNLAEVNPATVKNLKQEVSLRRRGVVDQLNILKAKLGQKGTLTNSEWSQVEDLKNHLKMTDIELNSYAFQERASDVEKQRYEAKVQEILQSKRSAEALFARLNRTSQSITTQIDYLEGMVRRLKNVTVLFGQARQIEETTKAAINAVNEIPGINEEFGKILDQIGSVFSKLTPDAVIATASSPEKQYQTNSDWLMNANFQ